jgi:hypothetical protein
MTLNVKVFPKVTKECEEYNPERDYFNELTANIEYADI